MSAPEWYFWPIFIVVYALVRLASIKIQEAWLRRAEQKDRDR